MMNARTHIKTRNARSLVPCLALATAAWLGAAPSARAQCASLFGPVHYAGAGFGLVAPASIAIGDINRDGRPDLLLSNQGHHDGAESYGSITVLWGYGDGTFDPAGTDFLEHLFRPAFIVLADFNGDQWLDVAVQNRTYNGHVYADRNTVTVLMNDGNGALSGGFSYINSVAFPCMVGVGDVNNDGRQDLVVPVEFPNFSPAGIDVLLGDGNGWFAGVDYVAPSSRDLIPTHAAVADLNHDNLADLVTVHHDHNAFSVKLSNGDGTFGPSVFFAADQLPLFVAIGDVNNDSSNDVVLVNEGSVLVLLGDGNGAFAAPVRYNAGATPVSVAIGDINGDGWADLAVAHSTGNNLSVLLGSGFGAFGEPFSPPGSDPTIPGIPIGVAIGDLNGDGRPDVALSNASPSAALVYLNIGTTLIAISQQPVSQSVPPLANATFSVAAASSSGAPVSYRWRLNGVALSNDGQFSGVDTATLTVSNTTSFEAGQYDVVVSGCPTEARTISSVATLSVTAPTPPDACDTSFAASSNHGVGLNPTYAAIADMNSDGLPDLIATNFAGEAVSIALGVGAGAFAAPVTYPVGGGAWGVAIGDLNGDGNPDLAIANHTAMRATIMLSNSLGQLVAQYHFPTDIGPIAIAIGDFNADGRPDLATANYYTNDVTVLLGLGGGQFAPGINIPAGSIPLSVAADDLNGDGRLDLVVANGGASNLSMFLGNGDGTFAAAISLGVGLSPSSVAIGDVNADGRLDLVTVNFLDNTVSVLLGNGNGAFAPEVHYAAGTGARHVSLGDLNGDGRLDAAVSNFSSNNVSVLLGNGHGAFAAATNWAAGINPIAAAIADLDADGRPDLAVANNGGNNLSVLLSNGPSIGFSQQPQDQSVAQGANAVFATTATGDGPFTYQWRRDGAPIVGATSSTFMISSVTPASVGSYDVQVRGGCNPTSVATSYPALLTVGSSCTADFNHDGSLNSQDFFNFLTAFFAGCP